MSSPLLVATRWKKRRQSFAAVHQKRCFRNAAVRARADGDELERAVREISAAAHRLREQARSTGRVAPARSTRPRTPIWLLLLSTWCSIGVLMAGLASLLALLLR